MFKVCAESICKKGAKFQAKRTFIFYFYMLSFKDVLKCFIEVKNNTRLI